MQEAQFKRIYKSDLYLGLLLTIQCHLGRCNKEAFPEINFMLIDILYKINWIMK